MSGARIRSLRANGQRSGWLGSTRDPPGGTSLACDSIFGTTGGPQERTAGAVVSGARFALVAVDCGSATTGPDVATPESGTARLSEEALSGKRTAAWLSGTGLGSGWLAQAVALASPAKITFPSGQSQATMPWSQLPEWPDLRAGFQCRAGNPFPPPMPAQACGDSQRAGTTGSD
ncbi:hypothetical protein GGTG_02661 [Gaeumannomyces tritici R3-111a-1]|uniref:Uncharacterized protein n=1 Tax=Gaeumannomyces tritici (strain R3-111a-1) TaxID=644352 RepID=J3NN03_GAET3|nr:hypothetical protein GGTG_02661 [Gaeumannomyces tritici R3-111a-1]EJT77555.1 hypothetical protein GGTG_02661 [Gaeumannomyces tritici R3-111a-1]